MLSVFAGRGRGPLWLSQLSHSWDLSYPTNLPNGNHLCVLHHHLIEISSGSVHQDWTGRQCIHPASDPPISWKKTKVGDLSRGNTFTELTYWASWEIGGRKKERPEHGETWRVWEIYPAVCPAAVVDFKNFARVILLFKMLPWPLTALASKPLHAASKAAPALPLS